MDVEWKKRRQGQKVNEKKRRRGQNVKKEKASTGNNAECEKRWLGQNVQKDSTSTEITPNGKKTAIGKQSRMKLTSAGSIVDCDNVLNNVSL